MKFYFPFENNVLSLFRYALVKRYFPLISPFTDNTQIISLDFVKISHASFTTGEKRCNISKEFKISKIR